MITLILSCTWWAGTL